MAFGEDYGTPNNGIVVPNNRNMSPGRGIIVNGYAYNWATDPMSPPYDMEPQKEIGNVGIFFRTTQEELIDFDVPSSFKRALMPGSTFTFSDAGAASAKLVFSDKRFLKIPERTMVWIHLDNSRWPSWKGWISSKPVLNDTEDTVEIECLGIAAQLKWGTVLAWFNEDWLVWQAVDLLARDHFPNTDIHYEARAISKLAEYPCNSIKLVATSLDEAFSQLATLAGDFEYGVDEFDRFFFRPRITSDYIDEASVWWEGYDFADYTGSIDIADIKNVAYVKHPTADEETGTLGFGVLEFRLEDWESMGVYGWRVMTVNAPSQLDPVDAYRFASVELMERSKPRISRKLSNLIYTGIKPRIPGKARIWTKTQNEQGVDVWEKIELWKKEITYTVQPGHLEMTVTLDSLPHNLVGLVAELNTTQARVDLAERTRAY